MMRYISVFFLALLFSCAESEENDEGSQLPEKLVPENAGKFGDHYFYWIYEDEFSPDEKKKLKEWVEKVGDATIQTLGQYPFDVEVVFHRSDGDRPVSFGHTDRGVQEGVHFYVNPTAELNELLEDWTAPHEIAHLSLPFSGPRTRWFTEGYATYLSRRIMINMGHYTNASFDSLYRAKINENMDYYGSATKTHLQVSDSLMDNSNYGSMYWGSSSFFLTADSLLQINHGMRFEEVVVDYQKCCRMEDEHLQDVMNSYDSIIEDTLFNGLMYRYRNLSSKEVMSGY